MTEQGLTKLMKAKWPDAFCIGKETWYHLHKGVHERKVEFKIYIVTPNEVQSGLFFRSEKDWQTAYDRFKLWKGEQNASAKPADGTTCATA